MEEGLAEPQLPAQLPHPEESPPFFSLEEPTCYSQGPRLTYLLLSEFPGKILRSLLPKNIVTGESGCFSVLKPLKHRTLQFLNIQPTICPPFHPLTHPPAHPPLSPSISLSIHPFISQSACPSIYPSNQPLIPPSGHPSIHLSIHPPTPPIHLHPFIQIIVLELWLYQALGSVDKKDEPTVPALKELTAWSGPDVETDKWQDSVIKYS